MGIQLNGSSGADIISSSDGTITIDGTSTVSTPIVTNTITISDKISHTGDSNTHIRFAGDDTVTIETAGSERLRIDASGHMGLGITPSDIDSIGRSLNIASSTGGAIYLQDTDAPTSKFAAISYNGGTAALQIHAHHSASTISLGTNGTERAHIHADGEVEIKPSVAGQTTLSVQALWASGQRVNIATFGRNGNDVKSAITYNHGTNVIEFGTTTNHATSLVSNNTERIRIDSSGNICGAGGIINLKHTSATGNVNVNMLGVSGDSRLDLENTGNGNYSGIDFVRERASGTGVVGGSIFMQSNTANNLAHLYIQAQSASAQSPVTSALAANNGVRLLLEGGSGKFGVSTGDSERFVINGAGDVLIPGNQATSNETGKLDIYHAADDDINNPHIRLWGAGNNDARIEFGSPTNVGEGGYISYNDADEGLYIGSRMGAYSEVNLCTGMNDGSPHTKIRLSVKADGRVMTEVQNGRGGIGMVGAFMARVAAVYDFAAGTRKIVMTNEEFDANGWYDASNSRYTPLCKGWYQMHFHLQFKTGLNNNSVEMQLYPYFNGAALPGPVQGWDNNHGNYAYNSWSTMIYFDGVDDYVEFYGNCSHTTDVNTATRMMGYLVHPLA